MSVEFACGACGSPSVVFPARVTDDAAITCAGCGLVLATWAEFKRSTRQSIRRDGGAAPRPERTSAEAPPEARWGPEA